MILFVCVLCITPEADAATIKSKAGAVTTSGGNLNVRSAMSSGASVVAVLKKGSYITLMEKSGTWWRVEYAKGKYGYCHADYITVVQGEPVSVNTSSGTLNVRSGPGSTNGKVASLAKGEFVLWLKEQGDWSRVLYHGTKTGWVNAKFLSNYYSAVSMNVPNFKQTDSRWANEVIGSSGKTFAQIGCATTAIAMIESFRRGISIFPNTIAKELRYTSSGNVYWPEHFKAVTGYSLSSIYDKLRQGKPVLLGATNSYGSQHWVVITGYTGGTKLTASGFTINDPGTWSRTNLQQFLNAYSTFYKYFYY